MPTVPLLPPKPHSAFSPRVQVFAYRPFDFYVVSHTLAIA